MSFQVISADGTEIKESVATAEEEFKNSTAEETERKLAPEDQEEFKNRRTEKLKRKLVPEDEEDFKSSTVEETERKVIPEDEDDEEEQSSGNFSLLYNHLQIAPISLNGCADFKGLIDPESLSGRLFPKKKKKKVFHLEDKDDEKDKELPRTQSMDNLLLMQKPQHQ